MEDLQIIFNGLMELYTEYRLEMPILDEYILGSKWLMSVDKDGNLSLAFRIGEEENFEDYTAFIKTLINKPLDECIKSTLAENRKYRGLAVSLCNLMSKPLNSREMLLKRNIKRTEGQNFNYDFKDKKVGLVGYGPYVNIFLNNCKEFHVFDLKSKEKTWNTSIKDDVAVHPKGIFWHLGKNAVEYKEYLKELDIVLISGSTVVNNSYIDILKSCKNASIKGIYGPSCELLSDYFFDIGFNYVFSTSVKDKDEYLKVAFAPIHSHREFDYMNIYELTKI